MDTKVKQLEILKEKVREEQNTITIVQVVCYIGAAVGVAAAGLAFAAGAAVVGVVSCAALAAVALICGETLRKKKSKLD